MTSEFETHTAVTATGEGVFDALIEDGWRVGGAVNGGYLMAVLGRAMGQVTDKPDPLAVSAYYLGPTHAGPAEVRTRVLRDGRATATLAADLLQNGTPTISALATYGRLDGLADDVGTTAEPPALPPLEDCLSSELAPPDFRASAPILDRVDIRFDPATVGWAMGAPSGRGLLQGWFRLRDRHEPDPLSLLTVLDAFPPVTFDLGRPGWAPTMELTAHVRAVPAPGWLRVSVATRNVAGGMFEEDCEVWDSAGRLVAQSRQLARQPR